MGKGQGNLEKWIVKLKKGKILIEISEDVPIKIANQLLKSIKHKLPVTSKIIKNN